MFPYYETLTIINIILLRANTLFNSQRSALPTAKIEGKLLCFLVCVRAYDFGVLSCKKGFALRETYLAIQSPLRLRKTFEVTQKTPCSYAEGVVVTPPKSEYNSGWVGACRGVELSIFFYI